MSKEKQLTPEGQEALRVVNQLKARREAQEQREEKAFQRWYEETFNMLCAWSDVTVRKMWQAWKARAERGA